MTVHIHCPTDMAVLVLAVSCPDGLLRFPNDDSPLPGLLIKSKPMALINDLLAECAHQVVPAAGSTLHIWQDYRGGLKLADNTDATMYVARLTVGADAIKDLPWPTWATLPNLIRSMPKDRNRLAYLKAWQVLTGALDESTKALDVNEVVKHLKSLESNQ